MQFIDILPNPWCYGKSVYQHLLRAPYARVWSPNLIAADRKHSHAIQFTLKSAAAAETGACSCRQWRNNELFSCIKWRVALSAHWNRL